MSKKFSTQKLILNGRTLTTTTSGLLLDGALISGTGGGGGYEPVNAMLLTGDQQVTGVKTFNGAIIITGDGRLSYYGNYEYPLLSSDASHLYFYYGGTEVVSFVPDGGVFYDFENNLITARMYNRDLVDASGKTTLSWSSKELYFYTGQSVTQGYRKTLNWQSGMAFYSGSGNNIPVSLNWRTGRLYDSNGALSIDYNNRGAFSSNGTEIFNWSDPSYLEILSSVQVTSNAGVVNSLGNGLYLNDAMIKADLVGLNVPLVDYGNLNLRDAYGDETLHWGTKKLTKNFDSDTVLDWENLILSGNWQTNSTPSSSNHILNKGYLDSRLSEFQALDYGNGSDGNSTLTSGTVSTLSNSVFYDNLTIHSGATLNTNGFKVYVKNTLTNSGFISNSGANGGNANGITGAASIAFSYSIVDVGMGGTGSNGLNGGTTAGSAGVLRTGLLIVGGNRGGITAGNGGAGASGSGGSSSSIGAIVNRAPKYLTENLIYGVNLVNGGDGGSSGGSGGGDGSNSGGGGGAGGNGGGVVFIRAKTLNNFGVITAQAGNGGNGGTPPAGNCGGGGGGAGGGGGLVYIVHETGSVGGYIHASSGIGGAGGAGVGTGGVGLSGSAGVSGVVLRYCAGNRTWY